MDVQIRDSEALSRISPPLLRRYLENHRWKWEENWRGRITVWSTTRDERRFQVLAPLMELSDTYAVRISEAVSTLAAVEDRSQLDVYYELMAAGADVIRLRTLNGRGSGRRSLSESVDLLRNAREMVRAAAHAAERPGQPVYRGRASGAVTEYVNGVQPQPGYESGGDLILHSKVPPDYGDQTDLGRRGSPPAPRSPCGARFGPGSERSSKHSAGCNRRRWSLAVRTIRFSAVSAPISAMLSQRWRRVSMVLESTSHGRPFGLQPSPIEASNSPRVMPRRSRAALSCCEARRPSWMLR